MLASSAKKVNKPKVDAVPLSRNAPRIIQKHVEPFVQ